MLLLPDTLREHRDALKEALDEGRIADAVLESLHLSPGRVSDLLAAGPPESAVEMLQALPPDRAGAVLGQMPSLVAADVLRSLELRDAAELFGRIRPEYAGDIYHVWLDQDPEWAGEILDRLEEPLRSTVRELGSHPAGTAGAAMTIRFLAIPTGSSVTDTIEAIRGAPAEVERTAYVYVVDDGMRLKGVVSVRDLFLAPRTETVDRIMVPDVVAVPTDYDAVDAARLLRNRGLKLLPVLDGQGRLAGVLNRDDAFDLLTEELASGFVRSAQGSPDESFFTPPMGAVRRRLPWMGTNVLLNLGAVFVISSFESTIAQVAILAAFLPMITDMGGNVGIQALSVAIRSIALDEVRIRDLWRAVRKEVVVGIVNGIALGALFATVAVLLEGNPWLGLVAGTALAVNVLVAGVVGGSLPFVIKRLGKDPAMMTGPFLTTVTDITGVSIYLGLSTLFLTRILGG
jgi:magnesium transporter